ncbi:DotD/TraH family lipoprotein [Marinimicrobium sp. ABcell2]|uniref:DotD/TraH family lipoprotein n=1 Tax=Marinimicrobium sp. ABcell2 TaxID=3069751 RepID=UPI0027B1E5C6|nr:DotD/TraH family lipoprotein [Marinimicrobium sp. ABcell2]MDQ2077514.1 DotD/TraH family lipoprotein [Marinimicrobium sp. ABcell2]
MKTTIARIAVVSCALSLAACATKKEAVLIDDANDALLEELVHATRDMQRQWGVTSRLTSLSFAEEKQTLDVSRLEQSMRRVYAFPGGYQGSLENLIFEVARLSGYDYLAPAGRKPVRAIPIRFTEEYRYLAEYVYDAGIQAGSRATVVLDMKNHTLQVIYQGF